MANEPLIEALVKWHYSHRRRPLRVVLFNTGGTFTNIPKKNGNKTLLVPASSEDELRNLLFKTLGLEYYVSRGLLELEFRFLLAKDSSQIQDSDRRVMVEEIVGMYPSVDGIIVIHGTDTGTRTAQFFTMSLPYYNPMLLWKDGARVENWTKPVVLLSSQEPAIHVYNGEQIRRLGSDADRNLRTALMLIAEGNVGEAGMLTNDKEVLRGTAATKVAEVNIPPYRTDPAIKPVSEYTVLGLRYPGEVLRTSLKPPEQQSTPFTITTLSNYSDRVLVVYESSHLNLCRLYMETKSEESLESRIKKILPASIIYVSVGAGNVYEEDHKILKGMEAEGIPIFRVPIVGGRIPDEQIYDVPGHDIPAINMLPEAAGYKVQATLALADRLAIQPESRKDFVVKMVTTPWGLEILPQS